MSNGMIENGERIQREGALRVAMATGGDTAFTSLRNQFTVKNKQYKEVWSQKQVPGSIID